MGALETVLRWLGLTGAEPAGPWSPGEVVEVVRPGRTLHGVVVETTTETVTWAPIALDGSGERVVPVDVPAPGARVRLELRTSPLDDPGMRSLGGRVGPETLALLQGLVRPRAVRSASDLRVGDVAWWTDGRAARCVVMEVGPEQVVVAPAVSSLDSVAASLRDRAVPLGDLGAAGLAGRTVVVPDLHPTTPTNLPSVTGTLSEEDLDSVSEALGRPEAARAGDVVELPRTAPAQLAVVLRGGLLPELAAVEASDRARGALVSLGSWAVVGPPFRFGAAGVGAVVGHAAVPDAALLGAAVSDPRTLAAGSVCLLSQNGQTRRVLVLERAGRRSPMRAVALPEVTGPVGNGVLEGLGDDLPVQRVSPESSTWSLLGSVDPEEALRRKTLPETVRAAFCRPAAKDVTEAPLDRGAVVLVGGEGRPHLGVVWEDRGDEVELLEVSTARRNTPPDQYRVKEFSSTGSLDPIVVGTQPVLAGRTSLRRQVGTLTGADLEGLRAHLVSAPVLPTLQGPLPRGTVVVATFLHPTTREPSTGTYVVWGDLDDVRDEGTVDCVSALIARERERSEHYRADRSPLSGHGSALHVWPHPVRIVRDDLVRVQGRLSDEDVSDLGDVVTQHLKEKVVPGRVLWAPVAFKEERGKIRPLVVVEVDGEVATALVLSSAAASPLSTLRSYTLHDWRSADLGRGGRVNDTRVRVDLREDEFLLGRYLSGRDMVGVRELAARTRRSHPEASLPRRSSPTG